MDFYQRFSQYYDDIFPFAQQQYSFLNSLIKEKDRVLDVACGTGNYIIELCKNNDIDGVGLDLDSAMIKKAETKGQGLTNLQLLVKNMLEIDEFNQEFDLVYCIGNSLPHLVDKSLILKFIQKVFQILRNHGRLVLQTVNYDNNPKSLKTIVNEEKNIKFIRNYEYHIKEGKRIVDFCTILEGKDFRLSGKVHLYPIKSNELIEMLQSVGFKEIQVFGSFSREEFKPQNSSSLVVLAKK
ncbi:class I SAM-dependent methyltransferase [Anaerobranca gottschalkii]|uniref:Methyltransferase domain-containing protein n=1 Tax=Anaerobranca gottschalkii DSM 13577 TaxID=1120990 RepID=A0A1H9YTB6_9FIRM|nr:class I SAM-dependent methyltransferase [Anaerobranca gottschalkii]SES72397.1 Methyltransferase domain-containing protein [Anaerobranca gottschalkii DSM 13577]